MELKIGDFGIARDIKANMTKNMCTPLYAAP
jgi:serine/threonine protein kinase